MTKSVSEDEAKKRVKKASKMMKPIESLECWSERTKTSDGEPLTFTTMWATHITTEDMKWIFDLFSINMFSMYKMSQWGWDPESKKAELGATTARYVIVSNNSGKKIAYVHYRFVVDHGVPSLYVYEIQVEEEYQKKGVGSILLETMELLAKKSNMTKVLATVFAYNANSLAFFHKNGYSSDETCPSEDDGLDYLILSKSCSKI